MTARKAVAIKSTNVGAFSVSVSALAVSGSGLGSSSLPARARGSKLRSLKVQAAAAGSTAVSLRKPVQASVIMRRATAVEAISATMPALHLEPAIPMPMPAMQPGHSFLHGDVEPKLDRYIHEEEAPAPRRTKGRKPAGAAASAGPISAAQAAKLARRDRVVLEHLSLVKAIAIRVHENLPVHVEVDDLVHAGILGLFDAATKFNPEKQVAFSSYAKHRIKGAILDSLRQLDWASRDMRRRHKQVEAATRELAGVLQRNPTEAEIAHKLGMDVSRWRNMMLDLRNVGLISASTRGSENEDLPAPDFPSKPETHPDSICSREQLRSVLGVAMKTLPERYQKVVVLYYTNEMTMKEIGGILGINESRVSQIHKSALEKMQNALGASGITSPQAF